MEAAPQTWEASETGIRELNIDDMDKVAGGVIRNGDTERYTNYTNETGELIGTSADGERPPENTGNITSSTEMGRQYSDSKAHIPPI